MDYLQYAGGYYLYKGVKALGFKPYYKWITFNTWERLGIEPVYLNEVLNLIINGLPSIHLCLDNQMKVAQSFKPYYKWITFNTIIKDVLKNEIKSQF